MKYVNDILWISRVHFKNYTPPVEIDTMNKALYDHQTTIRGEEKVEIENESNTFHVKIENAFIPFGTRYDGYYAIFTNDKNKLAFPLETQANKFTTYLSTQRYYSQRIDVRVPKTEIPGGKFTIQVGKLENNQFRIIKEQVISIQ